MARPRTNIRERIVRAARHEFLEHGRGASALRAIARRARTNLGMIYYYFPAKDDLFLAVIEEPYARMVDAIGALLARAEPARDRVRALYRWIGALSTDEVDTFRLVVSEALKSPELRAKVFARAWRGHLPLLFRLVEDARRGVDDHVQPGVQQRLRERLQPCIGARVHRAPREVIDRSEFSTRTRRDRSLRNLNGKNLLPVSLNDPLTNY